jgi:hypothetical protein
LGILQHQTLYLYQAAKIKLVCSAKYWEILYIKLFPIPKLPKASAATPQRAFSVFLSKSPPETQTLVQPKDVQPRESLCFQMRNTENAENT